MTHIVSLPSKKKLREQLAAGESIYAADPAVINPDPVLLSPDSSRPVGFSIIATNHPRRSWFAKITRTRSGWRVE